MLDDYLKKFFLNFDNRSRIIPAPFLLSEAQQRGEK
jgi:hypothetical protein